MIPNVPFFDEWLEPLFYCATGLVTSLWHDAKFFFREYLSRWAVFPPLFLEEQAFLFDGKDVTSLVALAFTRQSIHFTVADKSTGVWRLEG